MSDGNETGTGKEIATVSAARRYEVHVEGYDSPFKFTVVLSDYQDFMQEVAGDSGMASNNFILRTCQSHKRGELIAMFKDHWGLPALLMKELMNKMVDMRSTHLKNSAGV